MRKTAIQHNKLKVSPEYYKMFNLNWHVVSNFLLVRCNKDKFDDLLEAILLRQADVSN